MESKHGPKKNTLMMSYFIHHLRVFVGSLGHLSRQPLATLMTSAVIAIALALPANMFVAINNISDMSIGWDSSTQISLYLYTHVDDKQAQKLASKLKRNKNISKVKLISKQQGLKQFKQLSGFGDALKFLNNNPLPIVINIQPDIDSQRPEKIKQLIVELKNIKEVELAQLDMQ